MRWDKQQNTAAEYSYFILLPQVCAVPDTGSFFFDGIDYLLCSTWRTILLTFVKYASPALLIVNTRYGAPHTLKLAIGRTQVHVHQYWRERCCLPVWVLLYVVSTASCSQQYSLIYQVLIICLFIYMIFTGIIILKNGIENRENGISQRGYRRRDMDNPTCY